MVLCAGDIQHVVARDSTLSEANSSGETLVASDNAGLVKRQMTLILKIPYANSFNIEENWKGHQTDQISMAGFREAQV